MNPPEFDPPVSQGTAVTAVIVEPIEARYVAKAAQERSSEPWRLRPSNMGDCPRKLAFMLMGAEAKALSPETSRTFELGHARGARLEELAKEAWPDAQTQVPLKIELGAFELSGSCDLYIPSLSAVVDFKTIGGYGAGLLVNGEAPSDDYQLQIHAYRRALGCARAFIVYEVKDSDARKGIRAGQLIEREVLMSDELEKRYQARLLLLEGLLIRQKQGNLDPFSIQGLPSTHWKCRNGANGEPLYCAIGSIRGACHK